MLSGAEATFSVRMDGAEAWLMKAFRVRMCVKFPFLSVMTLNRVSHYVSRALREIDNFMLSVV